MTGRTRTLVGRLPATIAADRQRSKVESGAFDFRLSTVDYVVDSFIEPPASSTRDDPEEATSERRLHTGRRLGPYEIGALIGAGGMGEVYRARDTRLDRDVAVKVLPAAMAANPQALARFTREAKAVAALSHPNILAIHDVGIEDGLSFAVMELLEGETLRPV